MRQRPSPKRDLGKSRQRYSSDENGEKRSADPMLAKRQHAKCRPDQNDRGNHRAFKQCFVEFEAA